eukprot:UN04720
MEGQCIATQQFKGEEREIGRILKGGYFGERALYMNELRKANIKTWCDKMTCLRLEKSIFYDFYKISNLYHNLKLELNPIQRLIQNPL